ncbi:hypothetical protein [Thioclava electrotropha]|uniref:RNA polymerase alpha subunit C-terminal domain-containing protein n=1 Tax=Thioclava electrotropha TaxID=1549850 RepID=A0ABX6YVK9_9RHOB|nr:hypothetical protein [Thioclava electrotropha]QPZ91215.1 hypothetical protein AKL02_010080 [Thioclava electrotropha]
MNQSAKTLKRSAEFVVQNRKLSRPEEISNLTDAEILRIPGIGRKTLNALRDVYPFDHVTYARDAATEFEKRRQIAVRSRPHIDLGSIHNVTAARIVNGNLLIKVEGHKELLPVWLMSALELKGEGLQEGDGFGFIPVGGLIRMGISFPKLREVQRVRFMDFQNHSDFWTAEILITTDQATFKIEVFGEEEAPDGRAGDEALDNTLSFAEELKQDPNMADLHSKLEHLWGNIQGKIQVGAALDALRSLADFNAEVKALMLIALEKAQARGIAIVDEPFGLTSSDFPDPISDINDDLVFEWSALFPDWEGPLSLVGHALRILLEDKDPIQNIHAANDSIRALKSAPIAELSNGFSLCKAIATAIEDYHAELKAVGEVGILRKETIARIDSSFPDCDGIARRAIKRWIDARIADGSMLAVKSSKGQILRLSAHEL